MALKLIPAPLPLNDVPVLPGADQARQWAQEELSQKIYQEAKPGWAEQVFAFLKQALEEFLNNVGIANGNIGLAIMAGLALVAVIAIVLIIRPRLNRKKATTTAVFTAGQVLSSGAHRAMARTAAQAGDFHTAVSEQFRAMVRAAEERDVIVPAVGLTAREIVAELETAFPSHSPALHASADLFNAVRYGQVPPTAAMYEKLTLTDQAVAAATPLYSGAFPAVPV